MILLRMHGNLVTEAEIYIHLRERELFSLPLVLLVFCMKEIADILYVISVQKFVCPMLKKGQYLKR